MRLEISGGGGGAEVVMLFAHKLILHCDFW